MSNHKIFRDPVHGNVAIEDWICRDFIDTDVFQRLRFIEQSSMRLLFPSARHDRFIHSIGVFHIAKKLFAIAETALGKDANLKRHIEEFRNTFIVAALLHDCAHSPFSHTGEILAKEYCNDDIATMLKDALGSKNFINDFYDKDAPYATHEMASAYVGCVRFRDEFKKHHIDAEQFARMIIGQRNSNAGNSPVLNAYNCFILLLNGFIVDVDRLDYLLRDTWATGVSNASVDIDRILSGIVFDFPNGQLRVKQKIFSSLTMAVVARDFIFSWVVTHHKVIYADEMLIHAIHDLIAKLSKQTKKNKKERFQSEADVGGNLFSPERILEDKPYKICGEKIVLPTDGDILYLIKKYIPKNRYARAYLCRERDFVSLWKTYPDFMSIFSADDNLDDLLENEKFWLKFDAKILELCKQEKNLICTKARKVKSTHDQLLHLMVQSDSCDNEQQSSIDLGKLLGPRENPKFFMCAFAKAVKPGDLKRLKKRLQDVFKQCIEECRYGIHQ